MKYIFLLLFSTILVKSVLAQTGSGSQDTAPKMQNPSGQKGITVYPARLIYNLDKGQFASQILNIGNFTDMDLQFVMDFKDWTRDTTGNHSYVNKGSFKQSCAGWLSFDKTIIELKAGTSTTLNVTMKVPDDEQAISEMKWTMLVIRTANEKAPPIPGVKVNAQIEDIHAIGIHVLQTPPNISNKELKMLSFNELRSDSKIYRITCKNVGGTEIMANFSIELTSIETGKKTYLNPGKPIPLFPDQRRHVDLALPADLPKGKYNAIALIDADDETVPVEASDRLIEVR